MEALILKKAERQARDINRKIAKSYPSLSNPALGAKNAETESREQASKRGARKLKELAGG